MRVLFAVTRVIPMVSLAWACRCPGHDVRVAGPRSIAKFIRAAGSGHVPVAGQLTPLDLWPDHTAWAGRPDFSAEPWVGLAEHAIISDFAGSVSAADRLDASRRRFGASAQDSRPTAIVDFRPPSLSCFDTTGWIPMRHIPYRGAGIPEPWPWADRVRTRICVSMGSVQPAAETNGLWAVAVGLAASARSVRERRTPGRVRCGARSRVRDARARTPARRADRRHAFGMTGGGVS